MGRIGGRTTSRAWAAAFVVLAGVMGGLAPSAAAEVTIEPAGGVFDGNLPTGGTLRFTFNEEALPLVITCSRARVRVQIPAAPANRGASVSLAMEDSPDFDNGLTAEGAKRPCSTNDGTFPTATVVPFSLGEWKFTWGSREAGQWEIPGEGFEIEWGLCTIVGGRLATRVGYTSERRLLIREMSTANRRFKVIKEGLNCPVAGEFDIRLDPGLALTAVPITVAVA